MFGAKRLLCGSLRARGALATASVIGGTAALAVGGSSSPTTCASWFSSKPKVHLRYFKIDGVTGTMKHLMALADLEWTEDAWVIDFEKIKALGGLNPANVAASCPGFSAARDSGLLDANMARAPVIVVDGKLEIGQSKTIERYLARRLGLFGANEAETAQIDALTEHVRDIKDKYQKAKTDKDEKAKYFAEVMPEFMKKMDKTTSSSGKGPLIGASLSLADVTLFVFITDFFDDKELAKASVSDCPRLLASIKATGEHPSIVKYRASKK